MSKYSVGEREAAAWNVQLDLQWGKTGLIMSVVLCTLVGCQQPTAACTGLHKNKRTVPGGYKRTVSGGKGGAAA